MGELFYWDKNIFAEGTGQDFRSQQKGSYDHDGKMASGHVKNI